METWSVIGSDKNAGKTTVLNFLHRRLNAAGRDKRTLCLTSIGINGEPIDNYDNRPKPSFPFFTGDYFVTAEEHLENHSSRYTPIHAFAPPTFSKKYILARCRADFDLIVEGPNDKREILLLKEHLQGKLPHGLLIIDGSIDRQFLAHPKISDGIFFSLLITDREEQLCKAGDILFALSLPVCDEPVRGELLQQSTKGMKSLLLDEHRRPIYSGDEIPFLDQELRAHCLARRDQGCLLYLNGALSRTLYDFLSDFCRFQVILNNFTLYQNISVDKKLRRRFEPELTLLNPPQVKRIFLHRSTDWLPDLPKGVPVSDLFRDNIDSIEI